MANVTIKTAHGYLSVQPDGRIEFRDTPGEWETFTMEAVTPIDPIHDKVTPSGKDAIDLTGAKVAAGDCPDVRTWPIVAKMQSITFAAGETFERGDTMVEFEGRDALPPANSTQGRIAYTLWMGCKIGGTWHILPIVECIRDYVPTGRLLQPGQLPSNLFYYADPPLRGYQPAPEEQVAFFCTTGDTRRQNAQAVPLPGRTNAVVMPFRVGSLQF
jgi:hypothetical protein